MTADNGVGCWMPDPDATTTLGELVFVKDGTVIAHQSSLEVFLASQPRLATETLDNATHAPLHDYTDL